MTGGGGSGQRARGTPTRDVPPILDVAQASVAGSEPAGPVPLPAPPLAASAKSPYLSGSVSSPLRWDNSLWSGWLGGVG